MADYTVKRIDDMEGTFGGAFKLARAELGVTSFGMQIIDLPPNLSEGHPNHDHAETGQEEVYLVLRGAATLHIGDDDVELTPDVVAAVPAQARRHLTTGAEGARVLALGGVPGSAYEINPTTELGASQR
jgi:mannose-6-phosphate isomerase-like protein (cupin superfamily)